MMRTVIMGVMLAVAPLLQALPCEKVIISGYHKWSPYSEVNEGSLTGAGVDLTSQMFQQLDIPVEISVVEKQSHLKRLLKHGEVDILVATYADQTIDESVQYVMPAFFEDAIAVVVRKGQAFEFERWHDLMGRTGISIAQTRLGQRFEDFAKRYLALSTRPSITAALRTLSEKQADYLVGSAEQIRATLIQTNQLEDYEFLPTLVGPEKVYIAFSKASACREYIPFIQGRITQYQNDGTIERIIQQNVVK